MSNSNHRPDGQTENEQSTWTAGSYVSTLVIINTLIILSQMLLLIYSFIVPCSLEDWVKLGDWLHVDVVCLSYF